MTATEAAGQPPHDLHAEANLLGSMLLGDHHAQTALTLVTPDRLYDDRHRAVFDAIACAVDELGSADPVAVATELDRRTELRLPSGINNWATYLGQLIDSVASVPRVEVYAEQVTEVAHRRRLLQLGQLTQQLAVQSLDDPADLLARIRVELADIEDRVGRAGLTPDERRQAKLVEAALERKRADLAAAEQLAAEAQAETTNSWAPVDLGPYLRGEVERAEPSLGLSRTDGIRLLYPGKEHAVVGEMEAGKSWLCLASVAAELMAGEHVVYIHFEEGDPGDSIERLRLLGVPTDLILTRFRFVGPERMVSRDALDALLSPAPSLVVLDGVNEGMALHSLAIRDEDGAAAFRRLLVKPCTRVGAAVLSADHVVKDPERRGRYGLGSVHKGNGLSGALIMMENAEPFGRSQRGRSRVFITKDRPGSLRQHGRPDKQVQGKTYMGELVVDDSQTYGPDLTLRFFAPPPDEPVTDGKTDGQLSLLHELILGVFEQADGKAFDSQRSLLGAVRTTGGKHRRQGLTDALDDLVARGLIATRPGRGPATGYVLVEADPNVSQDHDGTHSGHTPGHIPDGAAR
ncbi:DnaB-like helicase N-terminal domain-containing protein [Pseudonocardia sp. WMMC193]|uniref:DnaB-like helicase N-terminal domain-containing protein n=1 Tax=Pseudonocardia sp. WMMC193 TaxID=2911965 RepID=UPI001F4756FA|nr:DnaB-like helicase N-terminal domain-containing protein [Pseudonocardia sp. WMMC193]MCF7548522.1 hypothetical protein [Pseudonocardia sp. WMMC193]